jgi:hypothetical protein
VADNTKTREDSRAQFEDTPRGWQERWEKEMTTAEKMLEKFVLQGDKVVNRYLDRRDGDIFQMTDKTRLNLFHSGTDTIRSMLYGQVPKIDFDRRYADPNDDVARVASEMYERILNADIERPDDDYSAVLRSCLDDRLLPGMGVARVRYDAAFKQVEVPAIQGYGQQGEPVELAPAYLEDTLDFEKACIDYVHWKDFRYSYARTWHEVRWVAFRSWLSYDDLKKRFEDKADKVPLKSQYPTESDRDVQDAWQKGEIWEIWCKETRHVYWWSEGMQEILDYKPDTLQLKNFLPCPRPMLANTTTSLLVPKADFTMTQDLYNEIDSLSTRINILTRAVRVVGAYDKNNPEVQRVLSDACENAMIPVENWGGFSEKKGLEGAVSWFPLEAVVGALDKLRELRSEQIELLYQVTGLSDILRGQAAGSDRVSATEQSIKAKFASVRMQALQDEFARFGTDLIRLKGEVMARHFQPQTILEQSNVLMGPDAELAQAAVSLIQKQEQFVWRVYVRPESMAMVDYQALQSERTGYIAALSQFLQSMGPMVEQVPGAMPVLLELLQWGLAGFKGSQQIEGVLDRAIAEQKKNPPQEKPDPNAAKMQMEGQKMQMEQQMAQQQAQLDASVQQQKMQADQMSAQQELVQDQQRHMQEMQQDQQRFMLEMQELRVKMGMEAQAAQQKTAITQVQGEQKVALAERAAEVKERNSGEE